MQSPAAKNLQNKVASLNPRLYAILIGLSIGITGGLLALLLAVAGPILTLGAVFGLLAGLYILTNVEVALYGLIGLLLMLPFGTFPVKIAITPTLIDLGLVAFLLVYLFQWMTGKRRKLVLTPVHALIALYAMWLIFAFILGWRYGNPNSQTLRQFAEMLLSIAMSFVLVDLIRDSAQLRRLTLVIMAFVGLQAVGTIILWLLPDTLAETLLVRLSRLGYPNGGVIRYVESNPALGERAIGTWVDPNTLGGILASGAALIATQLFAKRPLFKFRWLSFAIFGATALALFLTSSRASFLALGTVLMVLAVLRYPRFIPLLIGAGLLMLLLPQTQAYIDRIFQAFQGADLATQMRLGEWKDAINLIQQYPFTGIGFTGTPTSNVYTDVASMYLIMANQIGLTGVALFLLAMAGIFTYAARVWQKARECISLEAIYLGYHMALLSILVNAVADLYFFRLDFQASITWFWIIIALSLAVSRLLGEADESPESPVVTQPIFR